MTKFFSVGLGLVLAAFLILLMGIIGSSAVDNLFAGASSILAAPLWNYRNEMFGAFSLFFGTFTVAMIGLTITIPIALSSSIFLSEFLSGKPRAIFKVCIELVSGVPSIVIGLIGVVFLRRLLSDIHESLGVASSDSLFTAGCLLSIMLLPTATSLMDDAFRCVPRAHREAALGLGLSRVDIISKVVLPQARSGVFAAILLAVGRSLGETVAVFLVVGRADRPIAHQFSFRSLFEAGQTITSKLGGSEIAIAYGDSRHWSALMALSLVLWCIVGVCALFALRLTRRQRSGL